MSARAAFAVAVVVVAGAMTRSGAAWAETSQRSSPQTLSAAAGRAFAAARAGYEAGSETLEVVYTWSRRWLDAQRRARPTALQAAGREHRARMVEVCALAERRVVVGAADVSAREACAYYLAEADLLIGGTL